MNKESDLVGKPPKSNRRAAALPTAQMQNVIRPLKARSAKKPRADLESSIAATQAAERSTPGPTPKSPQTQAMPDAVLERFVGIGGKYYFPDGAPAFVDRGHKLTTQSENVELVRSLISIAQARGWTGIAVSGTERFRKEAWAAAQAVGLAVKGYKPSEIEQAQLVRAVAKHRAPAGDGRGAPASSALQTAKDPSAKSVENRLAQRGAAYTGRLLNHGYDTYRHDPLEGSSYFVRLQTREGEREIWGVDLERAIKHSLSGAKIGDEVTVRAVRRQPVTVPAVERDRHGEVIGRKPKDTHRNEWIVERTDFLADRQRIATVFRNEAVSPQRAVKQHPELQGSYLKLQAVHLGAQRDFKDVKTRQQLIDRARVLIAESIERGEPLEPVALRDHAARRAQPRAPQPEIDRAR